MSPAEYVSIAVAIMTAGGAALGAYLKAKIDPMAATIQAIDKRTDAMCGRLDRAEDSELQHRQAGKTWAKALHGYLVHLGHHDAPDPEHFPGI